MARPDIAFASPRPLVPVVGVCLVDEYDGALVQEANAAVRRLVGSREVAIVPIDTRLDANRTALRSPVEVESLLARMDVVVTTRLHAMVLALKNGVPVIAIDPEAGGAKVRRQAEVIGWPAAFGVDTVTDRELLDALDYSLTPAARATAQACHERAVEMLRSVRDEFLETLRLPAPAPGETRRPIVARLKSFAQRVARRTLPAPVSRQFSYLKMAIERADWGAARPFGRPRQVAPVSRGWGFDRGLPIDRHYVEGFLSRHAADVRGRVLEIGDAGYTRRFGCRHVVASDVLNAEPGVPGTTIVADLTRADHIPSSVFDCVILTQTLHLIYDVPAVIGTLHRILKPGGVLLATFPGITRISVREHPGSWYWSFTSHSARRLFEESFGAANVTVESHGNVLAASAFLYGLATSELTRVELDWRDPEYEVLIAVRAVRAGEYAP